MKKLKIAVASDHAGFERKQAVLKYLQEQEIEYNDFGAYSAESSDYPDFAHPLANAVRPTNTREFVRLFAGCLKLPCWPGCITMPMFAHFLHGI